MGGDLFVVLLFILLFNGAERRVRHRDYNVGYMISFLLFLARLELGVMVCVLEMICVVVCYGLRSRVLDPRLH